MNEIQLAAVQRAVDDTIDELGRLRGAETRLEMGLDDTRRQIKAIERELRMLREDANVVVDEEDGLL